jgi:hypothetical protein
VGLKQLRSTSTLLEMVNFQGLLLRILFGASAGLSQFPSPKIA